jgi:uncharacterized damage-inducible protein DinB
MNHVLVNSFIALFERELGKLETEISQYPDEASLWKVSGQITNPPGNLCLHLCGNLQHYIGALLGSTGYLRNRAREFAERNITRAELLNEIQRTKLAVATTLKTLDDASLHKIYPEETLGYSMTTVYFLNHLFGHFSYHLGQINYHRRIVARSAHVTEN